MKFFLFLIFIIFLTCYSCADIDFSYYHKSDQIDQTLTKLITTCKTADIKATKASSVFPELKDDQYSLLKFYDVTSKATKSGDKQNVFLLSGEHPRELIAVETLFGFFLSLCNPNSKSSKLLTTFNFRIIVNSNPYGRLLVEKGEYCKRTNLDNVDINRNWDTNWSQGIASNNEENPGDKPFSELETKFILNAVKDYNPKLFLTIHAGVYGLYLPYAYLEEEGKLNYPNMKKVSEEIQKKFCSACDVGPPSLLIGYKSSGNCLDYIYDNFKVPYSLAWEIYTSEKALPEYDNTAIKSENLPNNNNAKSSYLSLSETDLLVESSYSTFYGKNNLRKKFKRVYSQDENNFCVNLFNPHQKDLYNFIVNNWIKAIVHLLEFVKKN